MKHTSHVHEEKEGQGRHPLHSESSAARSEHQAPDSRRYLFDNPKNVKRLLRGFFLSLLVLLLLEVFVYKHPHFAWEAWPEFYAVFGFVACVALVLAAKYILRPLVKRGEDYYD